MIVALLNHTAWIFEVLPRHQLSFQSFHLFLQPLPSYPREVTHVVNAIVQALSEPSEPLMPSRQWLKLILSLLPSANQVLTSMVISVDE